MIKAFRVHFCTLITPELAYCLPLVISMQEKKKEDKD